LSRSLLALLLLAACATPYQPFEGRPVLAEIRFEGNNSFSGGEILRHIATAPTSGFFSKTPRYYDPDLFAIDIKRIERWYNEQGFYQAKVENVQEERDDKGRVILIVKIKEGLRAFVRKMDYLGLDAVPPGEMSDINDALPIHPGDRFTEEGYEKSKEVLLEQLKEHGFAQAQVRGRVEIAPQEGAAHVMFDCQPGALYTFGSVNVSGNRRVSAEDIANATGIHRGDRYSPQGLGLAQQRVYNLGTFSGVRVGVEPLGDSPVANVRVNVREAPFQTVRLGIGGSAEQTRWELPRLRADYTNRSLFGGLRRLELSSTIGYAFVPNPYPTEYDPSQSGITTQNSAQVTVPNVFRPGLDWVTRAEFAREVQQGFSYDDVAGRIGLIYRRGSHSVGGSLNFIRYFNVKLQGLQGQQNLVNVSPSAGIVQQCTKGCTLTYPELRYVFDGRDNVIEPTQGFYASIDLQQTLRPGSFSYFRISPEVRAYAPATRYAVLAMRAIYGGLFPENGSGPNFSPFTQRFFFGGQNEQRGYAPLRQGPKYGSNPVCDVTVTPGCVPYATVAVPRGGNGAALVSAELRIHADWLLNHLGVVTFVDASSVGDEPKRPIGVGFEVAVGLGVRYITPFGPIRFDVGWLVNPRDIVTDPVYGTPTPPPGSPPPPQITVVAPTRASAHCPDNTPGCIKETRWAFHITLGEAF